MERYTIAQRIQIVEFYIQSSKSVVATIRKIKANFGRNHSISKNTVKNIVDKFYQTGSVHDLPRSGGPRTARSAENIAAVSESVRENPRTSVRHRAQELGLSRSSTHRILRIDLHLHPYKVQLRQQLKVHDHRQRREFAAWALEHLDEDENFFQKIIFSDEAHFHLNGYVNKQNCRIWGSENPNTFEQAPMHPQKVTVWCGLWVGGIIGPYFFENDEGQTVTVNEARYREMLEYFLWAELEGKDLDDMWFQQDGATAHTTPANIGLLRTRFPGRVISRFGDVNWPPRSCDLTPLDFFLWGYVKDKVYANHPQTIPDLKTNIRRTINEIPDEMLERVVTNAVQRMAYLDKSRGEHLKEIIFHT
jgi:hypothetical protein